MYANCFKVSAGYCRQWHDVGKEKAYTNVLFKNNLVVTVESLNQTHEIQSDMTPTEPSKTIVECRLWVWGTFLNSQ